jgi:L-ascorbate metabolism protein UlaG (beta-lactamase superfamily)
MLKNKFTHSKTIHLTQIRNATIQLEYAGKKILIDPMLAKKGAYPGFEGTVNSELRNPLVELPFEISRILDVDAIVVTHLHPDHWDEEAQKVIPKNKLIFAQDANDTKTLKSQGFSNVVTLTENTHWEGMTLIKTKGQHGTDDTMKSFGEILGMVSGVVFTHPKEKTVYLAGDTIMNKYVEEILEKHNPQLVILNAGAAVVKGFPPIIMGKEDVLAVVKKAPNAKIIATHMEAVNHATLSRVELRSFLEENKVISNVDIPQDGQSLSF